MNVLVVNAGSSSFKFQVIATDLERIEQYKDEGLCRADVEGIGGEAVIRFRTRTGPTQTITSSLRDVASTLEHAVRYVASDRSGVADIKHTSDIQAVGHRVVHGGEVFQESALIDDYVLQGIEDCIDLAPLHNPNNMRGIRAARELFGKDVLQVAVSRRKPHGRVTRRPIIPQLL